MYAGITVKRRNTQRLLAEALKVTLTKGCALVSPRTGQAAPSIDYYVGGYGEALIIGIPDVLEDFDGIVEQMVAYARSWGLKTSERHTYYGLRRCGDEIHFDLSERYSSFSRASSVARERSEPTIWYG